MSQKMTREQLEKMLSDTRWETEWRAESDRAAAYYDGKQLTARLIETYKERGLAPLTRNLVGPTVDLVLGVEAKSRRDFKVVADLDTEVELADAMSFKLKQAERVAQADRACSDAFASMVKTGVGWVEVARESDPFRPPYRTVAVHRNEIFWDFRSTENDLSDARYLIRRRWVDQDIAMLRFPKKRALLERAIAGWADWDESLYRESASELLVGRETEALTALEASEWRDTERKRLCLYETWYRNWVAGVVARLPSGRVIEVDLKNPRHIAALESESVELTRAVFPKVRLAWWCGPHQLADIPSPYPHGAFPYVPFFGYREDGSRIPYGLIRRMMSPQDEVNARLMRMMWLLSAKRVIVDSDALAMPHHELVEEVARPDAVIYMNENRKNRDATALQITTDFQLSQQQFQVLQDAKGAIQDAAGVYQSMLGKSEYAGQSGLAISNLVEQGSTTLAEINDNFRYARRQVGLLLLSLVREDIGRDPQTVVITGAGERREVALNVPTEAAEGFTYLSNDVANTQMHVELEDVPDTPTYRNQQFSMMIELAKSLPPEMQPLFADFMVRASDLPFRHELADRIAKQLGLGSNPAGAQDPAQQAAQQAEAARQAEVAAMQQEQQRLALQELSAKVDEASAKAEKARADAQLSQNRAMQVMNDTDVAQRRLSMDEDMHDATLDEKAFNVVQKLQNPVKSAALSSTNPRPTR